MMSEPRKGEIRGFLPDFTLAHYNRLISAVSNKVRYGIALSVAI